MSPWLPQGNSSISFSSPSSLGTRCKSLKRIWYHRKIINRSRTRSGFVLLFLFWAAGLACVVAIMVLSLVPSDARPDLGLAGQLITSSPTAPRPAYLDWDVRQ